MRNIRLCSEVSRPCVAGVNDAAKQRVLHIAAAAVDEAVRQPELEQARLGELLYHTRIGRIMRSSGA